VGGDEAPCRNSCGFDTREPDPSKEEVQYNNPPSESHHSDPPPHNPRPTPVHSAFQPTASSSRPFAPRLSIPATAPRPPNQTAGSHEVQARPTSHEQRISPYSSSRAGSLEMKSARRDVRPTNPAGSQPSTTSFPASFLPRVSGSR